MDLGLTQGDVAPTLGVSERTVQDWEVGRSHPRAPHGPAIVRFLGYDPWRLPESLSGRLIHYRRLNGLTQPQLAAVLRVHLDSIVRWETGRGRPNPLLIRRVNRILGSGLKVPM